MEVKDNGTVPNSQPVAESFANRFIKRHGHLHCARCLAKVPSAALPHDCRDTKGWAAR